MQTPETTHSYGLTSLTPSVRGWEAFSRPGPLPTLGSFWSSHQWCQKSWVSLWGPLCAHGVVDTLHEDVCYNLSILYFWNGFAVVCWFIL